MVDEVFSFLTGRIEHSFRELLDTGGHLYQVLSDDVKSHIHNHSSREGVQALCSSLQAPLSCKTFLKRHYIGLLEAYTRLVLNSAQPHYLNHTP